MEPGREAGGGEARAAGVDRWVPTTCGFCSVGCGLAIGVRDGRPFGVCADAGHPANQGRSCASGLGQHRAIGAPGRARVPLLRRGRTLEPVGWAEAVDTLVERVRAVQGAHGLDAVAVLGSGRLVTEEAYALGKLVQLGLDTRHLDDTTTLSAAAAVAGYRRAFGSDGSPGVFEDFERADVVFLIGANPAETQPVLHERLAANVEATLIVADPRATPTAAEADLHLALAPGSDVALLNGLAREVIEAGRADLAFIDASTEGFDDFRAAVADCTLAWTAEVTGLPPSAIAETARLLGEAPAAVIAWGMGVNHSTAGAATVNAITNLALLTGSVGRPGASAISIAGQSNSLGAREAGCAGSLPGFRRFESPADREELARLWRVAPERVPARRGLAYPEIVEAMLAGDVRALWVIGGDPLASYPNAEVLHRALARLEFLAVQDGFHPTPTSALAHLVLPAAIWGEKEGTCTSAERRVSRVRRAVEPPGEARSDFDIFLDVARAAGCADVLFPGWTSPRDAFEEWRRVSAGRLCDCSGMTWEAIERAGGIQWPYPASEAVAGAPAAARRLHAGGCFPTPTGLARFVPVRWEPFPEQPSRDYPLVLNTGRAPGGEAGPARAGGWLEMHPEDARGLGLKARHHVDVLSRRGRVSGLRLRLTGTVAPGQVFLPVPQAAPVNVLTQSLFDPVSRGPNYKQCAVRVERAATRRRWWRRAPRPRPIGGKQP